MLLKHFRLLPLICGVLLASLNTSAQATRPAVEYRSLLNMKFVEAEGEFQIDALHIIFPPPGYEQATLTISTSTGDEIGTVPLRLDSYVNFPVFGRFVPESRPATIRLAQNGDFVLSVKLANQVITRFPFSVSAEVNSDPYAAPRRFVRDGPWRDFAYVSLPPNDANAAVRFNWWMSLRELPAELADPQISLRLFENHKEIARSREFLVLDRVDWQFFAADLIKINTRSRDHQELTLRELVSRDATYLLIAEADGRPIKSYRLEVSNRRLQRVEQSSFDFEPHADFIAPRFVDTNAGTETTALVTDAIWVRRSGVRGWFPPAGNPIASTEATTTHISQKR